MLGFVTVKTLYCEGLLKSPSFLCFYLIPAAYTRCIIGLLLILGLLCRSYGEWALDLADVKDVGYVIVGDLTSVTTSWTN